MDESGAVCGRLAGATHTFTSVRLMLLSDSCYTSEEIHLTPGELCVSEFIHLPEGQNEP